MADAKELNANLVNYRAQFQQVEAALTTDPDNEELLKLKNDLQEVINLTVDLMKMNEPSSSVPSRASSSSASESYPADRSVTSTIGSSLSTEWKVGDKCQAVWSQNGKYFDAMIDMISDDGTCTVTFDTYGSTAIVVLSSLRQRDSSKRPSEGLGDGGKSKKSRAEQEKLREVKRKKQARKKQKMKEVEEQREKDKNSWLDFFKGSKGKTVKGMSKKSIFASPESSTGKVGVGTCGIGGQPMTQFTAPEKLVYRK